MAPTGLRYTPKMRHGAQQAGCIFNGGNPCDNNAESYSFPSNTTAYTYYRLYGVSGTSRQFPWVNELYFSIDVFNNGLSNFTADDNGTGANLGDDTFTFDLNPSPGTGTYMVDAADGYTISPTSGTFGQTTSFTVNSTIPDVGDLVVQIIDPNKPCVQDVLVREVVDVNVQAVQAACAGPTDSPLSSIIITGDAGEITRAAFSPGTVFFGTDFASATPVQNLTTGFTLVNNLENPDFTTYYAVRAFLDETSFRDYVVSVEPKVCSVADLSLAIDPATADANQGENLTYTVTLTNNGPDPAIDVEVQVDIPNGMDLITASPSLGEYNAGSQLWTIDLVPLGNQTLTITYRMQ